MGHLLDGERRCWTCGSREHMATNCNIGEEVKPRAAKIKSKVMEKETRSTTSPEKVEVQAEAWRKRGRRQHEGLD